MPWVSNFGAGVAVSEGRKSDWTAWMEMQVEFEKQLSKVLLLGSRLITLGQPSTVISDSLTSRSASRSAGQRSSSVRPAQAIQMQLGRYKIDFTILGLDGNPTRCSPRIEAPLILLGFLSDLIRV